MLGLFKRGGPSPSRPASNEVPRILADHFPSEVLQLLSRRGELNSTALGINLLAESASAEKTSVMHGISLVKRLGLVVLDDADDSNPYCFITGGVAAGMVVHFNHDPEPRIEFGTVLAFENFLRQLHAQEQSLGDVEPTSPAHPDQVALAAVLRELARATEDVDAESLICLYLPLLRGEHRPTLEALAAHPDFLVREALADAIGNAALPDSTEVLRALSTDPHSQVRQAALRASAVLRLAHGGA